MPAKCCEEFFANLPKNVPVFTLVAYDKISARTVQFWIDECTKEGVNSEKVEGARDHLEAMATWARDNPDQMKLPD